MTMRVCTENGCPELVEQGTPRGRCPEHRREAERRRTDRGDYGHAHRQERKRWGRVVAQGKAICARCGERISPLEDWHLDHADDRDGYLGASHPYCNTAASRRGNG